MQKKAVIMRIEMINVVDGALLFDFSISSSLLTNELFTRLEFLQGRVIMFYKLLM